MSFFLGLLNDYLGAIFILIIVIALFLIIKRVFEKRAKAQTKDTVIKQIALSVLVLVGALLITLALPIRDELRGQVIGLIGIVISAAFALSATSFLGNAFAGVMNKIIGHFEIGDYIKVGDLFGRVSDMGLLHTEIQIENRDLVTLPNLFLATKPVHVKRGSGTIVSTTVSLGYDVSRVKIEQCLVEAAKAAGLTDAFVFIDSLGDFSVVYRVNGMQSDTSSLLTCKSNLNKKVLDFLHEAKIEIVSPTFMNQRQVNDTVFIPKKVRETQDTSEPSPESIIFDKAMKAETLQKKNERLLELEQRISEMKDELKSADTDAKKEELKARIDKWTIALEKSKTKVTEQKKDLENED